MAVDDAYTKSLLHFDGTDASTTFTDESGKTWTAHGNAQIDTAQSVFGGASGYFDGSGDYITTPDRADFDFDGQQFTSDEAANFLIALGGSSCTNRTITVAGNNGISTPSQALTDAITALEAAGNTLIYNS